MENTFDIHIGHAIKHVLTQQRRSAAWLASELHCCRTNVYLIFEKKYIDTELLLRISNILEYNFFALLSDYFEQKRK